MLVLVLVVHQAQQIQDLLVCIYDALAGHQTDKEIMLM